MWISAFTNAPKAFHVGPPVIRLSRFGRRLAILLLFLFVVFCRNAKLDSRMEMDACSRGPRVRSAFRLNFENARLCRWFCGVFAFVERLVECRVSLFWNFWKNSSFRIRLFLFDRCVKLILVVRCDLFGKKCWKKRFRKRPHSWWKTYNINYKTRRLNKYKNLNFLQTQRSLYKFIFGFFRITVKHNF